MWGLPNTNHQVVIEFRGASTDTDNPADAGLAIANFVYVLLGPIHRIAFLLTVCHFIA